MSSVYRYNVVTRDVELDAAQLIKMFCFFFQAEDGIRDLTVTGVQTCALPIYVRTIIMHAGDTSNLILDPDLDSYYLMDATLVTLPQTQDRLGVIQAFAQSVLARSEERRVGKEGRSRWSPYH